MEALGHHILLDLWGVEPSVLDDTARLETYLVAAARRGGAHVVEAHIHQFSPQGVSGVVILAESHLALHTWPERGFAALDVFTCGQPELTRRVAREVIAALEPGWHRLQEVARGSGELPDDLPALSAVQPQVGEGKA